MAIDIEAVIAQLEADAAALAPDREAAEDFSQVDSIEDSKVAANAYIGRIDYRVEAINVAIRALRNLQGTSYPNPIPIDTNPAIARDVADQAASMALAQRLFGTSNQAVSLNLTASPEQNA